MISTQKGKNGFTLIEILAVVAIIGVLSSVILSSINGTQSDARHANITSQLESIADAVRIYELQTGEWPEDTLRGEAPEFVTAEESTLSTWPKPPCAGASYDYENWTGEGESTASDPDIRVSVRDVEGGTYWYCIAHERMSDCRTNQDVTALGNPGEPLYSFHEVDKIQCE